MKREGKNEITRTNSYGQLNWRMYNSTDICYYRTDLPHPSSGSLLGNSLLLRGGLFRGSNSFLGYNNLQQGHISGRR